MSSLRQAIKAEVKRQVTTQRRGSEAFGDEVGKKLRATGITLTNIHDKPYGVRLYGVQKGGQPVSLEEMQRVFGAGKIMDLRSRGQQDTFGVKR